jgi:hypothetical protein
MAKFGLIKSFQIDNGELDGLRPQECFVLGYELAQVDQLLKATPEIERPVHANNRSRIESACEDAGRPYQLTWLSGDVSESWLQLEVAAIEETGKDIDG